MALPATSQYIGTTTIGGHIARAVAFQARTDIWMLMGKPTPWMISGQPTISDTNPPLPDPLTEILDEPVVARKATLQMVVPDSVNGTIEVYGQLWRPISPVDARANNCRHVLVSAPFAYSNVPLGEFDSYLTTDVAAGTDVLPVYKAEGYQVGDQVHVGGPLGHESVVLSVDLTADTVTIADPLIDPVFAGTFVSVINAATPFEFRQLGLVSDAVAAGAPGQLWKPADFLSGYMVEYVYNCQPIPRALNRNDTPRIVLTF